MLRQIGAPAKLWRKLGIRANLSLGIIEKICIVAALSRVAGKRRRLEDSSGKTLSP